LLCTLDQVLLQVVLLKVDHAGSVVAGLGQQVEAEDLALAVEGAADVPGHAFIDHALAQPQAVEDLQRAFGVADTARAERDGVVLVEQHDRQAAQGGVDRSRQAHRAGADDHQRHALGFARADLCRALVLVARPRVGAQHVACSPSTGSGRTVPSRSG
jgi:hypothetical protein